MKTAAGTLGSAVGLLLHDASYSWSFTPATGTFTDFGTTACHL